MNFIAKLLLLLNAIADSIGQHSSVWLTAGANLLRLDPAEFPKSWKGIISHGGTIVLQKDGAGDLGYFIIDPNSDNKLGIAYLEKEDGAGGNALHFRLEYSSEINHEQYGGDASAAEVVTKINLDATTVGKTLIILDENGNAIPAANILWSLGTGENRVVDITSNYIKHSGMADGATEAPVGNKLAMWSALGQSTFSQPLENLQTQSKDPVEAINEAFNASSTGVIRGLMIWKGNANESSNLQPGDVAMGFIDEGSSTFVLGIYLGGELSDLENSWNSFQDYDLTRPIGINFDRVGVDGIHPAPERPAILSFQIGPRGVVDANGASFIAVSQPIPGTVNIVDLQNNIIASVDVGNTNTIFIQSDIAPINTVGYLSEETGVITIDAAVVPNSDSVVNTGLDTYNLFTVDGTTVLSSAEGPTQPVGTLNKGILTIGLFTYRVSPNGAVLEEIDIGDGTPGFEGVGHYNEEESLIAITNPTLGEIPIGLGGA